MKINDDRRNPDQDIVLIKKLIEAEAGEPRDIPKSLEIAMYWIKRYVKYKELSDDVHTAFREAIAELEAENKELKEALQNTIGGAKVSVIKERLAVLNTAGNITITNSSGSWLCKHTDAMVKDGNNIMAYFMYFPTEEEAINDYFNFVTKSGRSILIIPGFNEYKYDAGIFNPVAKV